MCARCRRGSVTLLVLRMQRIERVVVVQTAASLLVRLTQEDHEACPRVAGVHHVRTGVTRCGFNCVH